MNACRDCGAPLATSDGQLCSKCRKRTVPNASRTRDAASRHRAPDVEPPHSRPWVNRRGG